MMPEYAISDMPEKEKISPNFVNEISELAERRLHELLEMARDLDVEILSLAQGKEEVLEHIREKFPERYELVVQKLTEEGIRLEDLSKEALLDRMLGIDMLFRFRGKTYIVDVTSGKHAVVVNKERKFQAMEALYRELGIDHALIIRLKQDITEEMALDLFGKLEDLEEDTDLFSLIVKYPKTDMRKKANRL